MLKALVRVIVEELAGHGQPVPPADVAERALRGYGQSSAGAPQRFAVRRELEDFVRELRSATS